jgi:hypothetical protein
MNNLKQQLYLLLDQCTTYEEYAEFLRVSVGIATTLLHQYQKEDPTIDSFTELFNDAEDNHLFYEIVVREINTREVTLN